MPTLHNSLKRYGVIALVLGSLTFLAACRPLIAPFGDQKSPPMEGESFAEFLDVPYPSIMGLDRQATFTYQRRGVMAGTVVVAGRMTLDEVGEYYDLHLPHYGWSPKAEAQGGKLVSTWVKGDKTLIIIASSAFAITGQDSRVELWIQAPFTKDDLGHRVLYRKSPEKKEVFSTSPQRRPKDKDGVSEENI